MNYDKLEHFCLFVGYPRSGHSIVGSMIDAHPDAIMAHELDFMKLLKNGASSTELYNKIIDNSKQVLKNGRTGEKLEAGGRRAKYQYKIDTGWHAKARNLKIIGDKRANDTTLSLNEDYKLLKKLKVVTSKAPKIIHVVRNPYDNIATMSRAIGNEAFNLYEKLCETIDKIRKDEDVLDIYQECLILHSKEQIVRMCDYLGLSTDENYLSQCAGALFDKPNMTRLNRKWTNKQLDRVNKLIDKYDWLSKYKKWQGDEKPIVFLMSGQSNMVGTGRPNNLKESNERFKSEHQNVSLELNIAQDFLTPEKESTYSGPLKSNAGKVPFGPEVNFGWHISEYFPNRKIVLIKFSENGSSLLSFKKEWSEEEASKTDNAPYGHLYAKMIKFTKEKLDEYGGELRGIIWMQGERDAKYQEAAEQYKENFKKFIGDLRSDLGHVPVLYGRINPPPRFEWREIVREAQLDLDKELDDAKMVDTDDVQMSEDNLHYSGVGFIKLGKKFALKFIEQDNKLKE